MTKQILKRADLLEWLGITSRTYDKFVEAGILRPIKLKGIRTKWFRRSDVIKALQLETKP